ncbi:MAG: von Willebrand factor type A domain-containing protein [Eubacterium sp.]|nr:von Willebrand factor type A domain-containing protein [Eubacterium sp.]
MKKNNLKKVYAMTLVAAMMAASLTGCGGEKGTTDADNTSSSVSEQAEYYETDDYVSEATEAAENYETSASDSEMVEEEYADETLNYSGKEKTESDSSMNGLYEEDYDAREYSHVSENDFVATSVEDTSTFAADVDSASYTNIRNYLNNDSVIPEDAVRIEEMVNYFHYDYREPEKNEPFSVNMEVDECPWNTDHQLVMIGLKAKAIDTRDRKPTNFVFLIDTSGSMNYADKLPLVKKAFVKLLSEINENDTVSIVTYAGSDTVVLEGECGENTDVIAEALENLEASGSTNGSAGINTAYEVAEEYFIKNGNNRVILATDGDLNVGVTSEEELTELISEKKESGIYLSVLGFGSDNLKDNKLEALADNGNGNYAYIDSVYEAKRVLVKEMGATLETVAKDVKLQTTFDSSVVEKYRLVGYENRVMANEDFDDDSVDGGEIGAGHEVTAIYEIIPTDEAVKNAGSQSNHILDLSIRYKEPDEDESNLLKYACNYGGDSFDNDASDNMLWAESVACFGMFLKDSEYKGQSSISLAKSIAEKTSYKKDALKVEYMELLDQAAEIYGVSDKYDDEDEAGYDDEDVEVNVIDAD